MTVSVAMRACLNSSNGENSIVDSFAVFPIQAPAALMYHSISWIACGGWALIAYEKYCRSPWIALTETVYLWLLQRSSCQVIGCRRCHNSHATVLWHACRVVGDTSWRTYPVCMPLNQTPMAAVSLAFMKHWGHIQLLSPSHFLLIINHGWQFICNYWFPLCEPLLYSQ